MVANFPGRVGIVQRVLPGYRAPFFDLLATHCSGGLSVFAGQPRPSEAIPSAERINKANWTHAKNLHIFGGPFYFCYQRGLIAWLEKQDPQVLVVEANPRYLSTPAAIHWMHKRGRRVIGWGLGAPSERAGIGGGLRKSFLHQLDAVIAYSERGASEYRSLGLPVDRIFVAPNAVSPRPSGKAPSRPIPFAGAPVVLYVGRLQKRKQLDSLIRASSSLHKTMRHRLVIIGDGPAHGELESLAREIYPATEFRGALFGAELDAAFAESDLFVLPGTGGLAVQQAMAHGLPVIVAKGDGSQEGLVSPANGRLLPPGDEAALRDALADLLSDAARLRNMGAESFRLVQEKFNLEEMVASFISSINKVAA
jgi:glycosyltransferase involved in cell wall biosynthesis